MKYHFLCKICDCGLQVSGLRDRANVCLNGKCFAVLDRAEDASFNLVASSGDILQLFVENLGRINFGKEMLNQRKVCCMTKTLHTIYIVALDQRSVLR